MGRASRCIFKIVCFLSYLPPSPNLRSYVEFSELMGDGKKKSAHNGRTPLHWKRSQRLSPASQFRRNLRCDPRYAIDKRDASPHLWVPKGARKSKPFTHHVISFTIADGKIWFRNYQISEAEVAKNVDPDAPKSKTVETELSLVEIGPRFVMTPIVILEGSFGGPVIYENKEFVSPNAIRADIKNRKAQKYHVRTQEKTKREVKMKVLGIEEGREKGELDDDVLFA